LKLEAIEGIDLLQLLSREQVAQVVVVNLDPIGLKPFDLIIDELLGDAPAVGEGGHAGDGPGEFAEVAAPEGFRGCGEFKVSAAGFGVEANGGGGDLSVALQFVVDVGFDVLGPVL
jgi:hypothetical protein